MMDFILKGIFKETGRRLEDHVELTKLSPMYRLVFDDRHVDVYEDDDEMMAELAKAFPGEGKGIPAFNKKERERLIKLLPLLARHNNNIFDAFRPSFLKAVPTFAIGKTLYQVLGKYFKSDKARLCFTFQSKYLGMSPWECPGVFVMVPFIEQQFGVCHARGGLYAVCEAMAKVVEEEGGKIRYGRTVKEVIVENGAAKGVRLSDGEEVPAEKIITPADWEKDFNVQYGAVFNLGHQLKQMLWFRPHNRFEEVRNVFLVGGGTHQGSGLPTIYESGKIAANLIANER